MSPSQIQH